MLWLQDAVCQPHDILSLEAVSQDASFERLAAIFKTISELLKHRTTAAQATDNYENHFGNSKENSSDNFENSHTMFSEVICDTDDMIDNNDNNCFDSNKDKDVSYHNHKNNINSSLIKSVHRSRYAEDRCISNFNFANNINENIVCDNNEIESKNIHVQNNNDNKNHNNHSDFEQINGFADKNQNNESNYTHSIYSCPNIENKINYVIPLLNEKRIKKENIVCDSILPETMTVSERINYFNNKRNTMNLEIKNNLNTIQNESVNIAYQTEENERRMSWICLGIFLSSLILLYIFPLPN